MTAKSAKLDTKNEQVTVTFYEDYVACKTLTLDEFIQEYWHFEDVIDALDRVIDAAHESLKRRFVDWSDDGLDVFAEYIALGMVNERPGWAADPSAAEIVESIAKEQTP